MPTKQICIAVIVVSVVCTSVFGQTSMTRKASTTTAVHSAAGDGVVLDATDYIGTGNNGDLGQYGVATFHIANPTVRSVEGAELSLTYNALGLSNGSEVEFFYTPDSAAELGGDFANLSYDTAKVNGINESQFVTTPVSLGTFAIDAGQAGGTVNTFDLAALSDPIKASLFAAVTGNKDFQIIIASTAADADITYSGQSNLVQPGDPTLKLFVTTVPEPSSWVLALGCLVVRRVRRRLR